MSIEGVFECERTSWLNNSSGISPNILLQDAEV